MDLGGPEGGDYEGTPPYIIIAVYTMLRARMHELRVICGRFKRDNRGYNFKSVYILFIQIYY